MENRLRSAGVAELNVRNSSKVGASGRAITGSGSMVRDDEGGSTSSMRFAHTEARGHMTMSMIAIMTLMRISMRYAVNEAKMPTSVCPSSIRVAANQNTAIWDRFMMSISGTPPP